jgi:hypothetical protein
MIDFSRKRVPYSLEEDSMVDTEINDEDLAKNENSVNSHIFCLFCPEC